jgi:hypothetical protein
LPLRITIAAGVAPYSFTPRQAAGFQHDEVGMTQQQKNAQRPLIVGKPALIMVDFQRGGPYVPGTAA